MTVDLEALERLYAAAIDRMPPKWKSHCILPPEHATRLHTIQDDENPPCYIVADKLYPRHGEWLVAMHNAFPALLSELRALREDAGRLEISHCTVCAGVPSDGFYTGCMIQDGALQKPGWACDGNGNLVRWKAAIDAARRKP